MKFLLTLLILPLFSLAQSSYFKATAFQIKFVPYSVESKRWLNTEWKETELTIEIRKNVISIDNMAHSTYVAVSPGKENYGSDSKSVTWDAVDEESKVCTIKLIYYKETQSLHPRYVFVITYEDVKIYMDLDIGSITDEDPNNY